MWTLNASAPKKDLKTLIDRQREAYSGQNYMDGQLDIVQPIVDTILNNPAVVTTDETVIDVTVNSHQSGGNTGFAINVIIH